MSALMFSRLAHNFIKNGYYPTDSDTMSRILNALQPCAEGKMNIIDPCVGEGTALAECQHHLGSDQVRSFAIEYDKERAYHAKQLLDHCIHGDFNDCLVSPRQFCLLFLNPPYGDLVADKAGMVAHEGGKQRLEKLFYQKSNPLLQFGGVMIFVIPHYALDKQLSHWIARHFERVQVFMAPEQRFKQAVIFGVKRRVASASDVGLVAKRLMAMGQGQLPDELPEVWNDDPYVIPTSGQSKVKFIYNQLDAPQLAEELSQIPTLWSQFEMHFHQQVRAHRRPLCQMTDWHLALALAAGQVSGVVTSKQGQVFVIKGDTYKDRTTKVSSRANDDGEVTEVRIVTDCFIPAIRALDFTPNSATFGEAFVIR